MRVLLLSALIVSGVLAAPMAPLSVPLQMAGCDAVFVGKVAAVDDKAVKAEMFKGDARDMQIARVTVSADHLGRPGKNVEVGFFARMGKRPGVTLAKGDEALFLLRKHPTRKNTYVADSFYSVVRSAGNPQFAARVAEAKKLGGFLADPMKALKDKDASARSLAASMLTIRYHTAPGADAKTEAVPGEESKLILQALAEGDWSGGYGANPQAAFGRLNLTAADGWAPPMDFRAHAEAAKRWLKENAGKYRMKRFVRGEGGPGVEP